MSKYKLYGWHDDAQDKFYWSPNKTEFSRRPTHTAILSDIIEIKYPICTHSDVRPSVWSKDTYTCRICGKTVKPATWIVVE